MTTRDDLEKQLDHDYAWIDQWFCYFYCYKCNKNFMWHTMYKNFVETPIKFKHEFLTCKEIIIKQLLE